MTYAYELLAKLRLLTLIQEDGQIAWIGTDQKWKELPLEEESILRDWDLSGEWGNKSIVTVKEIKYV